MNAPGMATKTPRDFGCPNWQQPSAGKRSADISPPPIWWPPYRNIYAAGLQARLQIFRHASHLEKYLHRGVCCPLRRNIYAAGLQARLIFRHASHLEKHLHRGSAGHSADISPPPIWWPPYRNICTVVLQAMMQIFPHRSGHSAEISAQLLHKPWCKNFCTATLSTVKCLYLGQ